MQEDLILKRTIIGSVIGAVSAAAFSAFLFYLRPDLRTAAVATVHPTLTAPHTAGPAAGH